MNTPNRQKIWTVLGPELGEDADKSVVIVRALDRLKSAGPSFWAHLVQCKQEWGFCPCDADADL